MAKTKTTFYCQHCGAQSPKWIGRCPSCGEWNSFVEELISSGKDSGRNLSGLAAVNKKPVPLSEVSVDLHNRIDSGDQEFNRTLGGGIVSGSIILLGGEPGIGKSTLLLQLALKLHHLKVLYVSGEESEQQIKLRADRLGLNNPDCFILAETDIDYIFAGIKEIRPDLVIIDSIQTLFSQAIESTAGSISQIRETAGQLQKLAKTTGIPVFLIGHITKDGSIAGPKVLEHMVDTVLQFEGDRNYDYRILRAIKNRFGSTSELGIYEMKNSGLQEVANPSELLLAHRNELLSGVAIASTLEGMRPMLIEIQALVSSAVYGVPQRSTTGFDTRRLNMLLAVLEKRCGFRLSSKDVFLNITGGIRIDDPATDMAVVTAVLSSNNDIAIDGNVCFAGEVGLSGEIRPVRRIESRISEAERLGFTKIFVSGHNFKSIDKKKKSIEIISVNRVEKLFSELFG